MPETRVLSCPLTAGEVAERADKMAKLVADEVAIEVAKKAASDRFKEQLDHVGGDIRRLAAQVRARAEDREIEIEYHHDEVRLTVETIRQDTGEVFHSRPMTSDEAKQARQGVLPSIGRARKTKDVLGGGDSA